jgi:hypothetical protein
MVQTRKGDKMTKGKLLFTCLSLILVGFLFFSSVPVFAQGNSGGEKISLEKAREGLEREVAGRPGFAGISHSEKAGGIIVFLENEQAKGNVPNSFDGFSVRKIVTGRFMAVGAQVMETPAASLQNQIIRTEPVRPLLGGISLSAYVTGTSTIYAGTLGMVTYDNKILTNAHVIAHNPDTASPLSVGTPVIQPGSYDGGLTLANRVGLLAASIPITFNRLRATNYADAAVATIDPAVTRLSGMQFSEDGNYQVSGSTTVNAGDTVRKSGRTTGVTTSTVYLTNASVQVYYTSSKWAYFTDQVIVNQPFIQAGDSGSCVDKGGSFVGLAFAASDTYAIVCKASHIIDGLGISVSSPTPDFSLSASPPSQTVAPGSSTSYTITITPSGGFNGEVDLSMSGLPSGATGSFSPNPATGSSALSVVIGASTPGGSYVLTITGTSGSLSRTTTATLVVGTPNFTLGASPLSRSVRQGRSTSYVVTITTSGGFNGPVTLSISGLPTGATGSFRPNPATTSSTLTVRTSMGTPTSTSTLTIMGIGGGLTRTTTVTLTVTSSRR